MAQRPNTQQEEDNLTRFRLVHPDKDVRALSKRLHRLPYLSQATAEDKAAIGQEKEAIELEVMKFAAGVERTVRGANKLAKQKEHYLRLKAEYLERAAALQAEVAKEKETLLKSRADLSHAVRCDSLALIIRSRPKTRQELDIEIAELQESVTSHRATHASYLATAQSRIEAMANITNLIQDTQGATLPVDPNAATVPPPVAPASELSAAAPAFRPKRANEDLEPGEVSSSSAALQNKKRRSAPEGPRKLPPRPRRELRGRKEDGEH